MVQRMRELQQAHGDRTAAPTERGSATRQSILDVAARAFAEGGLAGTSVNDIIREAGVTKGGFYFHFPSKEALALAVLRYKQETWAGRVLAATMHHTAAVDQMNAMVEALIDLHERDRSSRAIARICTELSEDPEMRPQLAPQFEVWVEMTAGLFAKAQQEGVVRPELDPHAMGEVAVAAFVGLEMMSEVEGKELRPRVRRYVDLLQQAFSVPTE
jgi:AcrR family transcriptional regulator